MQQHFDSTEQRHESMSVMLSLSKVVARADERIAQTQTAEKQMEELLAVIREADAKIARNQKAADMLSNTIKQSQAYLGEKQAAANEDVNLALQASQGIIGECDNIRMIVKANEAFLVDHNDVDIYHSEGGAFRSTASFLLRDAILCNTNYLKFMWLDEPLSTLSEESSNEMSVVLKELSKKNQVFLIEQSSGHFVAGTDREFIVTKSAGISRVEELWNEESSEYQGGFETAVSE